MLPNYWIRLSPPKKIFMGLVEDSSTWETFHCGVLSSWKDKSSSWLCKKVTNNVHQFMAPFSYSKSKSKKSKVIKMEAQKFSFEFISEPFWSLRFPGSNPSTFTENVFCWIQPQSRPGKRRTFLFPVLELFLRRRIQVRLFVVYDVRFVLFERPLGRS